jgi:hypothetical protein
MAIFEIGLIRDGMLIYEKKFYDIKTDNQISIETKAQFIDAIFNITNVSNKNKNKNGNKINILKFKRYKLMFQEIAKEIGDELFKNIYLVYLIGDNKLKEIFGKLLIRKVIELYFQEPI